VSDFNFSDLSALASAGVPLASAAVELIEDVIRAVAVAKEQDHDALVAKLQAARAELTSARADALAARDEGAAALKAIGDEESPK
jgi:hypothetical protein